MAARLRPMRGEPRTRLRQVTLFTPLRVAILDAIRGEPGTSAYAISKRLGRRDSRIRDNMRPLFQARLVYGVREPGRVSLYLNGVKPTLREPHARAQSVVTQRVHEYVLVHGEATMRELTSKLGLSRQQVGRALGQLERTGRISVLRRTTIARLRRNA